MSLKRTLASIDRDIKGLKTPWYTTVLDEIDSYWTHSAFHTGFYNIKRFRRNLPMFVKMAWNWRSWDYTYTIEALCVMLTEQAHVLKVGHCTRSEELYRRCMTASGLIRKAYLNDDTDVSTTYLLRKNPTYFRRKDEKYSELVREYNTKKELFDKIYNVASKRVEKAERAREQEAWAYLNKYIRHFWD